MEFKSDAAKIFNNILVGFFSLIVATLVLGAVFGVPLYNAHKNNEKVRELTQICIEKGYDGWADEYDDGVDSSACYNNR